MESHQVLDYPNEYEKYWKEIDKKPYLIHWAGCRMDVNRPIDNLFYNYLNPVETIEFKKQIKREYLSKYNFINRSLNNLRIIKSHLKSLDIEKRYNNKYDEN
jgi:hypothetical protein